MLSVSMSNAHLGIIVNKDQVFLVNAHLAHIQQILKGDLLHHQNAQSA